MSRIWRTIKGYVLWTYERGSFHYDVMVTVILLFVFLSPRYIDFKDKPPAHLPHVVSKIAAPDGTPFQVYEVDAAEVDAQNDAMVRINFQRILPPRTAPSSIEKIEAVRDKAGRIVAYRAWVRK